MPDARAFRPGPQGRNQRASFPSDMALRAEISVQVCLPTWPPWPKSACKFAFRPGPHGRNERASLPSDLALMAEMSVQVFLPTWPSWSISACKFAFRPCPHGRNQRVSLPSDLALMAEISVQVCLPTLATIGELAPPIAHTLRDPCATAEFDYLAPKLARNLRTPCADDPFVVTRAIHSSAKLNFVCQDILITAQCGAQRASIEAPRTV